MFNQLFKRPHYIKRHTKAPFLKERLEYIQQHKERGCVIQTLRDTAQYLLRIIEFLNLKSVTTVTLEEIEQAADKWARHQSKHPQKRRSFSPKAKEFFTCHAIKWLKSINRLALPEEHSSLLIKLFERGAAIKRHVYAPLLKERLQYLHYWAENGAVESSLKRIDQYLLLIMEYLSFNEIRTVCENEIKEAANRWARKKTANKRKNTYSKFARDRFIRDALSWFEMLGCLKKTIKEPIPFEEYLSQYLSYIRDEQGFSERTIETRYFQLKDFLIHVNGKIKSLSEITPLIIDDILTKKYNSGRYSRRTIQAYATVIRSFLRYAENKKWCHANLADSIKSPRVYSYESLPYSPSWNDVKKMLMKSKTDDPTDIRDYAILMLLSVYGMRCSEVVNLRLDDLDWKKECLYLRRAKRSKPQIFPFNKLVGEAILRYIKEVRPNNCSLREVFICMRSPYRALDTSAVYQIVSRRLKPLNLNIKHHGPHALRHACATHLINEGITLKEISDHLGHQGLDTTRIYAKVDLISLRKVADFKIRDLL